MSSVKEAIKEYQQWHINKFSERAELLGDIYLRNFGRVRYSKIIVSLFIGFDESIDEFKSYCEFVFSAWKSTTGHGANIQYFPNWLASQSMVLQYKNDKKTNSIKARTLSGMTFSDHSSVGISEDKPLSLKAQGR